MHSADLDGTDDHIGDSYFYDPNSFVSMLYHPRNYEHDDSHLLPNQELFHNEFTSEYDHTHVPATYFTQLNDDLVEQFINNIKHRQVLRKLKLKQAITLLQTDNALDKYHYLTLFEDELDGVDEMVRDSEVDASFSNNRPVHSEQFNSRHRDPYSEPYREERDPRSGYPPAPPPSELSRRLSTAAGDGAMFSLAQSQQERRKSLQRIVRQHYDAADAIGPISSTVGAAVGRSAMNPSMGPQQRASVTGNHLASVVPQDSAAASLDLLLGLQDRGTLLPEHPSGATIDKENWHERNHVQSTDESYAEETPLKVAANEFRGILSSVGADIQPRTPSEPPVFPPTPASQESASPSTVTDTNSSGSTSTSSSDDTSEQADDRSHDNDEEAVVSAAAPTMTSATTTVPVLVVPDAREQRRQSLLAFRKELMDVEHMIHNMHNLPPYSPPGLRSSAQAANLNDQHSGRRAPSAEIEDVDDDEDNEDNADDDGEGKADIAGSGTGSITGSVADASKASGQAIGTLTESELLGFGDEDNDTEGNDDYGQEDSIVSEQVDYVQDVHDIDDIDDGSWSTDSSTANELMETVTQILGPPPASAAPALIPRLTLTSSPILAASPVQMPELLAPKQLLLQASKSSPRMTPLQSPTMAAGSNLQHISLSPAQLPTESENKITSMSVTLAGPVASIIDISPVKVALPAKERRPATVDEFIDDKLLNGAVNVPKANASGSSSVATRKRSESASSTSFDTETMSLIQEWDYWADKIPSKLGSNEGQSLPGNLQVGGSLLTTPRSVISAVSAGTDVNDSMASHMSNIDELAAGIALIEQYLQELGSQTQPRGSKLPSPPKPGQVPSSADKLNATATSNGSRNSDMSNQSMFLGDDEYDVDRIEEDSLLAENNVDSNPAAAIPKPAQRSSTQQWIDVPALQLSHISVNNTANTSNFHNLALGDNSILDLSST
jgi:hypothetical protein